MKHHLHLLRIMSLLFFSKVLKSKICGHNRDYKLSAGGPARIVNGATMVLKGHRSIVNQVRFNPHSYMICSSGVEKIIKVRVISQNLTLIFLLIYLV